METQRPLMPKATAVWLVDNTTLTFEQIADFVGMHVLEVNGIADGDIAIGIKGADPVAARQLKRKEITRCEADPEARLQLRADAAAPPAPTGRKGRFTPVAIRQNRPSAIAWLLRYHPELSFNQISKLVGTTKTTIDSVRNRTHWNIRNLRPVDPVALGLCRQVELDEAVERAVRRKVGAADRKVLSNEERRNLMSTDDSLTTPKEPMMRPAKTFEGLENFSLTQPVGPAEESSKPPAPVADPEALFNLPRERDNR